MITCPSYYQRLNVDCRGKQADFSKYNIQLKTMLGIQGWDNILDPAYDATMPNTEKDIFDRVDINGKLRGTTQ